MLKVLKFGGSSMADAKQFAKVRDIVRADDSRRVVVVSAAGKRDKNDHKITDLLYLCHAHLQYGVSCDAIYEMIRSRYVGIRDELGLRTPLEAELDALRQKMDKGISADEFAPEAPVTRQEIATMLYRFAKAEAVAEDKLAAFPDAASVADWAKDAMNWAVSTEIVNGSTHDDKVNYLDPTATALRCQAAAVACRYLALSE